jgi:uncharacterized protein (TIGR03437 family)
MPVFTLAHSTRLKQLVLLLAVLAGWLALAEQSAPVLRTPGATVSAQALPPLDYDIVYVRAPRFGDFANTIWPEVTTPLLTEPGADLMLLHPNGSEEVLFAAGANGAVIDPSVAYDAKSILFSYFPDVRNVNTQRAGRDRGLSRAGADIYRLELATRQVTRLTNQEFTPNTGNGANFDCTRSETNCPQIGVFNTGPAFLPDGRIVFTSTRDNFLPSKAFNSAQRVLQLYVMDGDGKNVQNIGHLNLASALHPFVLKDGRIAFTSWENMGTRDDRAFTLWTIWPDGSRFEPFSGFGDTHFAHHFMTQLSNDEIVVCRYYNFNSNGFGELYSFPVAPGSAALFQPIPPDNAAVDEIPLKRVGYTRLTPFTDGEDFPAPCKVGDPIYPPVPCPNGNNSRVGKFTLPSAAPNNELLAVYTHGAANHNGIYENAGLAAPYYDGGIYRLRGNQVLQRPEDLVLVKNSPLYNEQWPRALVPYQQIYGVSAPAVLPDLKNDGTEDTRLHFGTPLALVGSSSLISRDTRPFKGDRFYWHENFGDRNWLQQGADAGVYGDDDIYALRILAMQPLTDRTYPNDSRAFVSHLNERIHILGEIPVRKDGVTDAQGNPDTSFLAKLPADVPFTFQTLDRNGLVLNMAQTWHQLRPGEMRVNCGGCHAHSKAPLNFATTAAAQPGYQVRDLSATTPLLNVDGSASPGVTTLSSKFTTLEYLRDIRPILQAKCGSCHSTRGGRTPEAGLNLDMDDRQTSDGFPATYAWLARPYTAANPTTRSLAPEGYWFFPQVTRYIRAGQARQSLLAWKIFGRRLDGRTNAERPTELVSGNPATVPAGFRFFECDLDYSGTQMPPPDSGFSLTWEERLKIARWIDLGAPIDLTQAITSGGGRAFAGFFEDDLRPTLALTPTTAQAALNPLLTRFVIGAYDLDSGLDPATLTLTLDRAVGEAPAGTNLAAGLTVGAGGTATINLPAPINLNAGALTATLQIKDRAGQTTRLVRTYRSNVAPLALTNVSAASYSAVPLAPAAIIAAFGTNLATATTSANATPLPLALAGTTVTVRDSAGAERAAPLFFVSPTQINYQMPPASAPGPATVTVVTQTGVVSQSTVNLAAVAPGLFSANASGQGAAAALALRVKADGTQSFEPIARFDAVQQRFVALPLDLGPASEQVFLIAFGTGWRNRTSLNAVAANLGVVTAPVSFAGAQGGLVGVDQLNVQIPRTLTGRGEVGLLLTVDGKQANAVRLSIK